REVMTMTTVVGDYDVLRAIERSSERDSGHLLTNASVSRARQLPGREQLQQLLLDGPHEIRRMQMLACFRVHPRRSATRSMMVGTLCMSTASAPSNCTPNSTSRAMSSSMCFSDVQ